MEVLHATLHFLLYTFALCRQHYSALRGPDIPTACCFSYTSRPIKHRHVVSCFETSSQCSKPAIIFQTKRGRQVCANPSEAWVRVLTSTLKQNGSQPGGARVPQ